MKINSHYTIITGLFKYQAENINKPKLWETYTHWQNRINGGDFKASFAYFNTSYYDGYLNNIFPEIRHDKSGRDNLDFNFLNHITVKSLIKEPKKVDLIIFKDNTVSCLMEFADLYLFPNGIGIFSIKVKLNDKNDEISTASDFINKIRQLNSSLIINNKVTTVKDFINEFLLKPLNLAENWNIYNPQLKTFNIIDVKEPLNELDMDYLLYDMGNVAPIGSGKGEGDFAPSESYFKDQMIHNKLSVFKNWSAISLFDTFTRISNNFPDTFKSWELDYFQIYIHCLHIKFYMYLTNSKVSDVTTVTSETEKIRNDFIEFVNDYYQTHISYKFLPDLIQDKFLYALEIHSEIEMMEVKIKRINVHAQEKRERRMNLVLLVITFLSVFSLIYDLSNWIINLGVDKTIVFPWLSISIGIIVIGSLFAVFRIKKK